MGSFFVPLTSDNIFDPDGPEPPPESHSPPNMLPGLSDQRAILYRSDSLVVAAYRFEAFPEGFNFTIHVEGRGFPFGRFTFIFRPGTGWPIDDSDDFLFDKPEDTFRVGLGFSDGTASDYLVDLDRGGPRIYRNGCSGSSGEDLGKCVGGFWVPQLPAAGEFTLHVEWPSVGLEECTATFDADDIVAKSANALPLLGEKQ